MKNSNQEFPDELITCLLHKSWNELNENERATTTLYFTEEEYAILHEAMRLNKNVTSSSKDRLLQAFDQHHYRTFRLNTVWKIAAMLLLFGVAALQLAILNQHKSTEFVTQIIRDTVVVEQQALTTPVHKYDTVYVTPNIISNRTVHQHKLVPKTINKQVKSLKPDVYVVPVDELKDATLTRRKNNIKSDSTLQLLSFVTL